MDGSLYQHIEEIVVYLRLAEQYPLAGDHSHTFYVLYTLLAQEILLLFKMQAFGLEYLHGHRVALGVDQAVAERAPEGQLEGLGAAGLGSWRLVLGVHTVLVVFSFVAIHYEVTAVRTFPLQLENAVVAGVLAQVVAQAAAPVVVGPEAVSAHAQVAFLLTLEAVAVVVILLGFLLLYSVRGVLQLAHRLYSYVLEQAVDHLVWGGLLARGLGLGHHRVYVLGGRATVLYLFLSYHSHIL